MTTEFQIDSSKLAKIAGTLSVNKGTVQKLYQEYQKFSPHLRDQYLAHIMRSVECYFRIRMKNSRFIVICEPYTNFTEGQKQASADYFQGSKFVINYNRNLPEKDLRAHIAHEIGHLFWLATIDLREKNKRKNMYTGTTEPLSSIFGIFIISEKNDFYANYDATTRNHCNWQEILDCFVRIQKEQKI
jgi:Zn-dependent peptidase ImmA (M78 family)